MTSLWKKAISELQQLKGISLVSKLIVKRFVGYYFAVWGLFTFLLFMISLAMGFGFIVGKGVGWRTYLAAFVYFSSYVGIGLFMAPAMLGAALLTMVHLVANNEFLAMRALGMSLWRIIQPLLFISIFLSPVTFFLYGYVRPWAGNRLEHLAKEVVKKQPTLLIRPGIFQKLADYKVFVDETSPDGTNFQRVWVYKDGITGLAVAEEGEIKVKQDGALHVLLKEGALYNNNGSQVTFGCHALKVKREALEQQLMIDDNLKLMDRNVLFERYEHLEHKIQASNSSNEIDVAHIKKWRTQLNAINWICHSHWMHMVVCWLFMALGCVLGALTREGRALLVILLGFVIGFLHYGMVMLSKNVLLQYMGIGSIWLGNLFLGVLLMYFGWLAHKDTIVLAFPNKFFDVKDYFRFLFTKRKK